MPHDDETTGSGDDPWADLEADGLAELDGEIPLAFDDEPAEDAVAESVGGFPEDAPREESGDEPADADIDAWLADEGGGGLPTAGDSAAASADEETGSWVHGEPAGQPPADAAGESEIEIGTGNSGISSPSSIPLTWESSSEGGQGGAAERSTAGDPFPLQDDGPEEAAGGAEAAGASAADDDPFASLTIEEEIAAAEEPVDLQDFAVDPDGGDGGEMVAAGLAAAFAPDAAADRGADEATGQGPARKKKSSPIGQLIGIVAGGLLSIPIVLAILLWGLGMDPFQLSRLVPDSLAFLLPAKFQPARNLGLPAGSGFEETAGGDQVVVADQAASLADLEPAAAEPVASLADAEPLEPAAAEPLEPAPTDLALSGALEPAALEQSPDDPLMPLIDETEGTIPEPADPAGDPPPAADREPALAPSEPAVAPLDLTGLEETVAAVAVALDAVAAVPDDPAAPDDKARRRLLAKCYFALAGYAEQLAALEQLAAESGRPFEPARAEAARVRESLAARPDVVERLPRLSRDWIAYAKRQGDGVVTVGELLESRRFGPSWRSRIASVVDGEETPAEIIVLSRSEPLAAPGEPVLVAGLAVGPDVVWAADIAAAEPPESDEPTLDAIFGSPEQ